MAHPRLQRRKSSYFARVAVPLALRPVIGKIEIVRSLKTGSHKEALARIRVVSVEVDQMFREAAGKLNGNPVLQPLARPPTEEDIRQAVIRWFWQEERASIERERAAGSPADLDEALHAVDYDLAILTDPHDTNTAAAAFQVTRVHILAANKLAVAEGSPLWRLSEQLVQRALVESHSQTKARLQGDWRGIVNDPLFAGFDPLKPPPKAPPLLSQAIRDFLAEHKGRWEKKLYNRYKADLDRFLAVIHDKPITSVTKEDAFAWKKVIARLPANQDTRVPWAVAGRRG
jgi:Domain of unknown function (DUF6538)